jgi:hypothetical protein
VPTAAATAVAISATASTTAAVVTPASSARRPAATFAAWTLAITGCGVGSFSFGAIEVWLVVTAGKIPAAFDDNAFASL